MPALTEEQIAVIEQRAIAFTDPAPPGVPETAWAIWNSREAIRCDARLLLAEVHRLRAAARSVLAAQGTSGMDDAIAALRVALEGEG